MTSRRLHIRGVSAAHVSAGFRSSPCERHNVRIPRAVRPPGGDGAAPRMRSRGWRLRIVGYHEHHRTDRHQVPGHPFQQRVRVAIFRGERDRDGQLRARMLMVRKLECRVDRARVHQRPGAGHDRVFGPAESKRDVAAGSNRRFESVGRHSPGRGAVQVLARTCKRRGRRVERGRFVRTDRNARMPLGVDEQRRLDLGRAARIWNWKRDGAFHGRAERGRGACRQRENRRCAGARSAGGRLGSAAAPCSAAGPSTASAAS